MVQLQSGISFNALLKGNIQTLSSSITNAGSTIEGLLYVPTLRASDPCTNISKQYIPHNVTRQANLPSEGYNLVAHAPWISVSCTKSYLASASSAGARAFLFYLVHGPPNVLPPLPNDPAWNLNDGGQWKAQNRYPVYALQPSDGAEIMKQLSLYSGNMTDAPNGDLLTEQFDSRNYVRLYSEISIESSSTLPSLWVFILIIFAMLLGIVCLTSFLMHLIQSRHRRQLRRMIINGQVDLEALGIKRLKVPPSILDRLPLLVYVANQRDNDFTIPESSPRNVPLNVVTGRGPSSGGDSSDPSLQIQSNGVPPEPRQSEPRTTLPLPETLPQRQLSYTQSTCHICLDDFIPHESVVRELPCRHIFHPECIDPVLLGYSSLCPICKGKILPIGHCPTEVTNAMVRRERNIRRMRERVTIQAGTTNDVSTIPSRSLAVGRRMASFHRQFGLPNRSRRRTIVVLPPMLHTERESAAPIPMYSAQFASAVHQNEPAHTQEWRPPYILADDEDAEGQDRLPRCKLKLSQHFALYRYADIFTRRAQSSRQHLSWVFLNLLQNGR